MNSPEAITEPTTAPSTAFADFILQQLRCAADDAVSPDIYKVILRLETELAWAEHQEVRP